jgi:tetratricopeptide (TPR) repeat protein
MKRLLAWCIALISVLTPVAAQNAILVKPDTILASAVEVRDVAVSRFGSYVAIYDLSEFNTIRLFDRDLEQKWTYQLSHYWGGSLDAGSVLAFSSDESELFFPGYRNDNDVCVCDSETGDPVQVLLGHTDDVRALSVSADGNHLVTTSRSEIVVWKRGESGFTEMDRIDGHEPSIQSVIFLPDGDDFITTARDDRQRLITRYSTESETIELRGEYTIEDNNVSYEFRHVAITPDGEWAVAGYRDDLYFFRTDSSGLDLHQIAPDIELETVLTAGASPDGEYIVSGHFGYLRWWQYDGSRWQAVKTTATQQPGTLDLEFSPDGGSLYVATSATTNALAEFTVVGVGSSPAGMIAWAVDGELSAEQRSVLHPTSVSEMVETVGRNRFLPRDMFETAAEFEFRRNDVRMQVRAQIIDLIAEAFDLRREENGTVTEIEIPLTSRGAYNVDTGRYTIDLLNSEGWLQISRDEARALFQNWEETQIRATFSRSSEMLVSDFRLLHPVSGAEYPIVLAQNPFTGDSIDEAQTVVPVIRIGPDLLIRDLSLQALFPTLRYSYARRPIGRFQLENTGTGIVSNVTARFVIDELTSTRTVELPSSLAAGQTAEGVLVAPPGDALDAYRQGGSAELVLSVSYQRGGTVHEQTYSRQVRILNRNAIQWDDDQKVAAFVSGSVPELVEIAARVTGSSNQQPTSVVTRELLTAMELFSAMQSYDITYVVDPNSSYAELSEDSGAVDYVRFPLETLSDRAGDCDDLSVLYASLLESVGVSTAFITTPGHIFVAFDSGVEPTDAVAIFESTDRYIVHDERVWLPVETTALDDGFSRAWQLGAVQWQEARESGSADLFTTRTAWSVYEPTPQQPQEISTPALTMIASLTANELSRFRDLELEPKISRADPVPDDPALQNRRGALLAAYGLFDDARRWFLQSINKVEYVPGLINLANLSALDGDSEGAQRYLERAELAEPENPRVLIGLALLYWESGDQAQARSTYERASGIRPSLARRYPLFAGSSDTTSRAGTGSQLFATDWATE